MTTPTIDELCINTIRFLSVDAVQKANSGHPGTPMGAAPMAYVLCDFLSTIPTTQNGQTGTGLFCRLAMRRRCSMLVTELE